MRNEELGAESGVWKVKSGVWSVKSGVWRVESGASPLTDVLNPHRGVLYG